MKFAKQFIISLIVSMIVTVLFIGPHSGEEYDRAPGAIVIGLLVLCFLIMIVRRFKSMQKFINETMPIVSSLLSFGVFCVVALASRSYVLGIFAAFFVLIMLISPKILWGFTLSRSGSFQELCKVRNKSYLLKILGVFSDHRFVFFSELRQLH